MAAGIFDLELGYFSLLVVEKASKSQEQKESSVLSNAPFPCLFFTNFLALKLSFTKVGRAETNVCNHCLPRKRHRVGKSWTSSTVFLIASQE